jgi:hypothetical protein
MVGIGTSLILTERDFLIFLSGIAEQGLIFNLNFKFGWK